MTASLGLARFPEHGASIEELMRHADIALYEAKRLGRGHAAWFTTQMAASLRQMLGAPPSPTRQHGALRRFLSPERHAARIMGLAESHFGLSLRSDDRRVRTSAPHSVSRPA